jgi:hypothetical protein
MVGPIPPNLPLRYHLCRNNQSLIQNRNGLDESSATEIMQHLINRFVHMVNKDEQGMVVRKLASSLVAIFRHPVTPWKQAVWQLAASLVHGGYVSEELARGVDFQERILPELNQNGSAALLFFSIALAEEALRLDSEPQEGAADTSALQRALLNIKDGLLLVQFVLNGMMQHAQTAGDDAVDVALGAEAMSSWKVSHQINILGLALLRTYLLIDIIARRGWVFMEIASALLLKMSTYWLSYAGRLSSGHCGYLA